LIPHLKTVAKEKIVEREWREHALITKLNEEMTCLNYWKLVMMAKNATGQPMFPNLAKVLQCIFSLPFSNVSVERVFSQLKLIKNDHRTALKQESLFALLSAKMAMMQSGILKSAAELEPSKEMLKLHRKMTSNATNEEVAGLRRDLFWNEVND